MSRKGTCLDNAVMEGFFSHLKEEWFRIQKPETLDEFHTGLNEYLRWWNTTRIQQRQATSAQTSIAPKQPLSHRVRLQCPTFGDHSMSPLVFSLEPRCHGECGSQK